MTFFWGYRIYKYINGDILTRKRKRMSKSKSKILRGWDAVQHCPELWITMAQGYPVQVTIYIDDKDENKDENKDEDKSKEKLISCCIPGTVEKTETGIMNFFASLVRTLDNDKRSGRLTLAEYSKALRAVRTRESAALKALATGRLQLVEGSAKGSDPVNLAKYAYLAGKVRKEVERLTGIFAYRSKIPDDILALQRRLDRYTYLRARIVHKYGRDHHTARRTTLLLERIRKELDKNASRQIRGNLYAVWQYQEFKPDALRLIARDCARFADAVQTVKTAVKRQYREILRMAGHPSRLADTCTRLYKTTITLPMVAESGSKYACMPADDNGYIRDEDKFGRRYK